jgi:hypothetical protein
MQIMKGNFQWSVAAICAAFSAFVTVADGAVSKSIPATADAYVRSGSDRRNFGLESQLDLRAGALSGTAEAYVQFPIPHHAPYDDRITLRVYAQLAEAGTAKIMVRSVSSTEWKENELTWRTRPEHKDSLGMVSVIGVSGAWYELDVTSYVKAEAAAGRASAGFALIPAEETRNRISIQSRESSKKPELLFSRTPVSARICFLPTSVLPPEGYLADNGDVYGPRRNGLVYGWSKDNTGNVRDRTASHYKRDKNPPIATPDRRYDFTVYMDNDEKMREPVFWEMAVPDGTYSVRLVAGDSLRFDSVFGLTLEGKVALEGVPDSRNRWVEKTVTVTVTDGRLTINNAPGSSNNKLCFVEITEIENLLTNTR